MRRTATRGLSHQPHKLPGWLILLQGSSHGSAPGLRLRLSAVLPSPCLCSISRAVTQLQPQPLLSHTASSMHAPAASEDASGAVAACTTTLAASHAGAYSHCMPVATGAKESHLSCLQAQRNLSSWLQREQLSPLLFVPEDGGADRAWVHCTCLQARAWGSCFHACGQGARPQRVPSSSPGCPAAATSETARSCRQLRQRTALRKRPRCVGRAQAHLKRTLPSFDLHWDQHRSDALISAGTGRQRGPTCCRKPAAERLQGC